MYFFRIIDTHNFINMFLLRFCYVFSFVLLFVYGITVLCFALSNANLSIFNMYFYRIIDTHNSIQQIPFVEL
jgi:hypothetical protein